MSYVPDINLMREVAEEKTAVFKEEYAKSEAFTKMCADIQKEANSGNFSKHFNLNGLGGNKAALAASELFIKGGYTTNVYGWELVVSWGRYSEQK